MQRTLAREGVDDLLLDTLLSLRETLILEENQAVSIDPHQEYLQPTFPTAMLGQKNADGEGPR